jgi:hypothetical protein
MNSYDIPALKKLMSTDRAAAGKILSDIRDELPARAWTPWVNRNEIRWESAARCLRAHDPVRWAKTRAENRTVPRAPLPVGEIHEATRGFKAMMTKAEAEEDMRVSHKRRTVAFQHFKFLLERSTLPALMKMSSDEIINLARKI